MNITDIVILGIFIIEVSLWCWAYTYDKDLTSLLDDMAAEIDKLRKEVDELKSTKENERLC